MSRVCNGTSICGCGQCPMLLMHYREIARKYPDLVVYTDRGDGTMVKNVAKTNYIRTINDHNNLQSSKKM